MMMGRFGNWSAGNWEGMPDYMQNMMRNYYGGNQVLWQISPIFDFAVQVLLIVLLVALIRWVWRKGDKAK